MGKDVYKLKVLIRRLAFLSVIIGCLLLHKYDLDDYLIVTILLTLFVGIFPISDVDINIENIKVRKSYFWSLIDTSITIAYHQVSSVYAKDYSIETHEEAFRFADNLFVSIILSLTTPKVEWTTAKLAFTQDGKVRELEVKLSRSEVRDIERRIPEVGIKQYVKYGGHRIPWY